MGLLGGSGRRPVSGVGTGSGGGSGVDTGDRAEAGTSGGAGVRPAAIKKHTYRELEDLVNR